MTEPVKVTFRTEGSPAFPIEAEKEPSEASPAAETAVEKETVVEEPKAPAADPIPFHEDPKVQDYISRQVDKRVEGLESKHREAVEAIRNEFAGKREANAEESKIPSWFGGNQQQWDEYRAWNEGQLKAAEERAINGIIERGTKKTEAEAKAVQEATDFFQSELKTIEADKTLNPSGKPIDPNALLKVVLDNELVDTKGRWNYRAGVRMLNSHSTAVHAPKDTEKEKDKKALAGATMSGSGTGSEPKPKTFKTSEDFKKKRPW